ncbi:hypothetical protein Gotri_024378 [Gossypium trilobum]|uniref:RNase H type-1 domain-containing protein n=1 Tax=Gossypium trilobum TaxID=34281 RepID=A0A7J9DMI0_9ROSI|nr:hypothetical protein [Gossypium trilobum]
MDQWSIRHVQREKNQVVDRIVKMTSDRIEDVHVFVNVLEELGANLCVIKQMNFSYMRD